MKLSIAVLVALAAVNVALSDGPIAVCDALIRPGLLDRKVVAIRGALVATDEGGWLQGADCGEQITLGGRQWRTIIWLEMSVDEMGAAGFSAVELDRSTQRLNTQIAKQGFDPKKDRLWATYVGEFRMPTKPSPGANSDLLSGFGHLNAAPAELIVKDVIDVTVEHLRK